jgi:hypothetical protein
MTDHVDTETGEVVNAAPRHVPAEIIKARIAVMKKAHGVGKSGRNDFHKYDYASDYDVLSLVQPAMAENGLALEMWPDRIEGPDADGNMAVRFLMQWQHESGAVSEPVPWYGVAQDRSSKGAMGDKWFNKAATAAEKYFLLKQFHIPAGKDVDPDSQSPHEYAPARNGQQQPAKTYGGTAKRGGTAQQQTPAQPAQQPASDPIRVVDAEGEEQTFKRTKRGALDAMQFIEDEIDRVQQIEDQAALWNENRATFQKLADTPGVSELRKAEGAQTLAERVKTNDQAFREYLEAA